MKYEISISWINFCGENAFSRAQQHITTMAGWAWNAEQDFVADAQYLLKKVNDIYFRYVRAAQKMSRKFVMQIEEITFFSVSRLAISREPPRATL